ncbi:hypothetical protein GCM10020255_111050 [Rhodococcus baikonurensis]
MAHRLGTAREDQVTATGLNLHDGLDDCLQSRPAPAIHLHAGNVDTQTGVQRRDASDRRSLTVRRSLAENDVVDLCAGNAGTRDEFGDQSRGEIFRSYVTEYAAEAADRVRRGSQMTTSGIGSSLGMPGQRVAAE